MKYTERRLNDSTARGQAIRASVAVRAARVLHDGLLSAVAAARLSFFQTTPSGPRLAIRPPSDKRAYCAQGTVFGVPGIEI